MSQMMAIELGDIHCKNNLCYGTPKSPAAPLKEENFSCESNQCYGAGKSRAPPSKEITEVSLNKPSYNWSHWCVVIFLFLVGIVACISMSVAAWSVAEGNNLELRIEELNALILFGQNPSSPAVSCNRIFLSNPTTRSGYYWVKDSNDSAVRVYCDMTRSCGGVTGGWMRVSSLNFSNGAVLCPSSFEEHNNFDIRTCGITPENATCVSVFFTSSAISYNKVCGKVLAYQVNTTDAFGDYGRGVNLTIDSNYVDGVSLTHGSDPREHIWTFAAAIDEYGTDNGDAVCECSHFERAGKSPPAFIGKDYFCDSGFLGKFRVSDFRFLGSSPLWDGSGCGPSSTCCSFNNPPWFYKQLPTPTSDVIEMRVCKDEGRMNEDVELSSVEIYVQ